MEPIVDQPEPGVAVPPVPAAPDVVTVVEDVLEQARCAVDCAFAAAADAIAGRRVPDFDAVATALLRLSSAEWDAWSPVAGEAALGRLKCWYRAQPTLAAAVAALAHDAREGPFQRALLRRRAWQYADAYREALAWRRMQFGTGRVRAAN